MLKKATASKAVEIAKAKLELDQAQLRLDQVEERRARNLLARKAASQEDYDKAEAQRKKSAAQVESDRASLEQAVADYKIDIDRAKADVERAKAALGDARMNLGYCRMSAQINGRIGELKVKVGSLVGDAGRPSWSPSSSSTRWDWTSGRPPAIFRLRPPCWPEGPQGRVDRRGRTQPSPSRQGHLHRQPGGKHDRRRS